MSGRSKVHAALPGHRRHGSARVVLVGPWAGPCVAEHPPSHWARKGGPETFHVWLAREECVCGATRWIEIGDPRARPFRVARGRAWTPPGASGSPTPPKSPAYGPQTARGSRSTEESRGGYGPPSAERS